MSTRPTAAEVASLIRARTKDDAGTEIGVFSSATRPTDVQVQGLILMAEGDVLAQLGTTLNAMQEEAAKSLVTLRSAMFVELSYWPEQVRDNRSAYEEYKRLYDDQLAALVEQLFGEDGSAPTEPGQQVSGWGSLPVRSWTMTPPYDFDQEAVDPYGLIAGPVAAPAIVEPQLELATGVVQEPSYPLLEEPDGAA